MLTDSWETCAAIAGVVGVQARWWGVGCEVPAAPPPNEFGASAGSEVACSCKCGRGWVVVFRAALFFTSDEQYLWSVSLVRWWCPAACWQIVTGTGDVNNIGVRRKSTRAIRIEKTMSPVFDGCDNLITPKTKPVRISMGWWKNNALDGRRGNR